MSVPIKSIIDTFADAVKQAFAAATQFNPEEQLKTPLINLFQQMGQALNLQVQAVPEVQASHLRVRPDLGIMVNGLLSGHIELKAPGKGADPTKFSGHDRDQWHKLQNLPNLIYTDGNTWALYRSGVRQGPIVRFAGDVTTAGQAAIDQYAAQNLYALFQDFLRWQPVAPASSRALAKLLAPLCRLLRDDVLAALHDPQSNLSLLATDWRKFLFPDADDAQFADAYAQTLTYAMLLARLSDVNVTSIPTAVNAIRTGHQLMADALNILADPKARQEIKTPVDLLERIIAAVDPSALMGKKKDPWLYFYEDFLAEYDPAMRKDRGVYYTPVEVVQAQVHLVAELLAKHFNKEFSFVDEGVITLDPAAGTGTYILAALQHGLDQITQVKGPGMRASAATRAAQNLYAFELLVGPYTVAHLRLTQQIQAEKGTLPSDGVHIYLTDTLESPHQPPPQFPFAYKVLAEEHKRAQEVKKNVPVLVCIGNPPYDRQQIAPANQGKVKRKGGWVRYGDPGSNQPPLLDDFLKPLNALGLGVHAKNLYNDYVYFWRWALWKVLESKEGGGIISFITASSYLRGPGFAGMREMMRRLFDELWIIDLEGDDLGARKTENVFAIRTPVAIAVGVRYDKPQPNQPAKVHYTRISGTQKQKLATLAGVHGFADLNWRPCLSGWHDPFLPTSPKPYWDWPLLTDLFPWQENGVQFKRTWPIAESKQVLEARWNALLQALPARKGNLLRETDARKVDKPYPDVFDPNQQLPSIASLSQGTPPSHLLRYAYRSFDRQWALLDTRLCDRPRPTLLRAHSDKQVYITSLLTNVLGEGPAAVATALIPDLDHFRGSFGAKHVIPLWCDAQATQPNVTQGVLDVLAQQYGYLVYAQDFFAYAYAVLATPEYVRRFWDELTIPGPRRPITQDGNLFQQAVDLGRRL
ncbi:MAG: type ISP restriction/modification enzyme, partial [Candidatus Methanomethylicaceae archaeon]